MRSEGLFWVWQETGDQDKLKKEEVVAPPGVVGWKDRDPLRAPGLIPKPTRSIEAFIPGGLGLRTSLNFSEML